MRCVFVLGLLISLCAPISAATAHHPRTHHHVIVRPSQSVVVPPRPIPPDENRNLDPSTWGGTCSGCAGRKRGDGGLVGRDAVKVAHQVLPSSVSSVAYRFERHPIPIEIRPHVGAALAAAQNRAFQEHHEHRRVRTRVQGCTQGRAIRLADRRRRHRCRVGLRTWTAARTPRAARHATMDQRQA